MTVSDIIENLPETDKYTYSKTYCTYLSIY